MEENISQKEKEKAEEEMIEQAFQELLNDYLATKHRKRVEIITKAFNFACVIQTDINFRCQIHCDAELALHLFFKFITCYCCIHFVVTTFT